MGLQTAKGRNTALLAKLNWRFHTKTKASWAKVLRLKYCNHQRLSSRNVSRLTSSKTWKGLKHGEDIFEKGIRWLFGSESKLDFWEDSRSTFGPLRRTIHGPLSRQASELKFKDVVDCAGTWNWNILQMALPSEIISELKATPIPLTTRMNDRLAWKYSPRGEFDLKSAYLLTTAARGDVPFMGNWIWKLKTMPRIQIFVWKCMHYSIGVNQCLMSRGVNVESNCPRCHREPESILHALRDCPVSKRIWQQLGRQATEAFFSNQNMREWLRLNAQSGHHFGSIQIPWCQVFLFTIWLIWKDRNQLVFRNKNLNPNLEKDILDRASEYFYCACNQLSTKRLVLKSICWEKPREGWLTLNVDGAAAGASGMAGGGGLIRDGNGDWVIGFARKIGTTTSFMAELWALRDGLLLCLQIQAQAVCVELDAKAVVDAFNMQNYSNTVISSIMDDCRHLASQISHLRVRHIYREANRCADFLAKLGLSIVSDYVELPSPPVDLVHILEDDACGRAVNRLCPIPLFSV